MPKVTAVVTNAVVDGKMDGEQVTLDEKAAEHLERIGYVRITGTADDTTDVKTEGKTEDKTAETPADGGDEEKAGKTKRRKK